MLPWGTPEATCREPFRPVTIDDNTLDFVSEIGFEKTHKLSMMLASCSLDKSLA